jgi:hypothetical protein
MAADTKEIEHTLASNWRTFSAKRSELEIVTQYCPERPYVELHIPSELRFIRRIIFKIDSHDQGDEYLKSFHTVLIGLGFSDDANSRGTYDASHSWFEVAAITPSGHDRTPRLRLASNLHGDFKYREQTICWERVHTSANIQNWFACVRPSDSIQVIPRAQYIAWQNYIRSAEIQLVGEVDKDDMLLLTNYIDGGTVIRMEQSSDVVDLYQPLSQSRQEIRILKVHPGHRGDEIVCTIESISLNDPHQTSYEGLSYCWGDPERTKSIAVWQSSGAEGNAQSCFMGVTANLHEALRHIRRDDQARIFWIDAICINQNDVHERSWQVAMMRQVYSSATGVVVWLGQSNPEVQRSIDDLEIIAKRYSEHMAVDPQATTSQLHHPLFEGGTYHLDSQLFQYDWFHRTWVLQEVFNAKFVSVHCGDYVLPWSLVLRLDECISRTMLYTNPIRKNVLSSLLAGLFELKEGMDNGNHLTAFPRQRRLGILETIISGLDLDATDPRDKIFALLSFGEETVEMANLPPTIAPNYSKCVSLVFAEFTRWWISTHQSLRILSSVHVSVGRTWQKLSPFQSSEDSNRASWSLWHDGKAIWARGTLGLLAHSPSYCASGSTLLDSELLDFSPSPMVLRLQGRIITTIAEISPYPYYRDYTDSSPLHTAYTEIFDPINTRGTWKSVTLRTELLGLHTEVEEEMRNKTADHYRAHFDYSSHTNAIECHPDAFFTTPEGIVGLCPAPARIGDKVAVLNGGNVPYLLRAEDGEDDSKVESARYKFVGECYLEGYMFGRAMDESEGYEKLPTQVFDLI